MSKPMTVFPEKFCLFAGGKEHLEEAKAYIKKHGLTSEDVRILCNDEDDELLVITRRDGVELKG